MDVLNALCAAVIHLVDNDLAEAEVMHTVEHGDKVETLTITVRRTVVQLVEDETEGEA